MLASVDDAEVGFGEVGTKGEELAEGADGGGLRDCQRKCWEAVSMDLMIAEE